MSHSMPNRPCFNDWGKFLCTHLKKLPAGFKFNCVFEFHKGEITRKHLITDTNEDVVTHCLCRRYYKDAKKDMQDKIFGLVELKKLTIDDVDLPWLACKEIDNKKVKSLSKKYHLISEEERWY